MTKHQSKLLILIFILAAFVFIAVPAKPAQAKTVNFGVYYGKGKVNLGFSTGRIWSFYGGNYIEITVKRNGKLFETKKVYYSYEDWGYGVTRYEYPVSKPGKYTVQAKDDSTIKTFTVKKAAAIKKYKPKITVAYYSDRGFVSIDTNWIGAKKIKIFRKVGKKGKWKCIATVEPGDEYLDYKTKPKKKYAYRAAVIATNGKKAFKSKYSKIKNIYHY